MLNNYELFYIRSLSFYFYILAYFKLIKKLSSCKAAFLFLVNLLVDKESFLLYNDYRNKERGILL
jgi:hypothetical protein